MATSGLAIARLQVTRMQGPHQSNTGNRGNCHPAAIDMSIGKPAAEIEQSVAHKILSGKF
ncbi:Uncharacterised protein [Klebsiella pneumoniae subsp. pneumoniae]|nr:Uncharacterised protein [Klebsiella pneumoniae subsp. pneumoniae]